MFKYAVKQMKRSFFTNTLFCLLLALAGALLCLTAGLLFSAHRALRDIDEVITTIAMPDMRAIRIHALNDLENNNIRAIETDFGLVVWEANDTLTLDGVDLIQNFLDQENLESRADLEGRGTEALIFHEDGVEELGFGQFAFHVEEMREMFAQGEAYDGTSHMIYALWLTPEENFRNIALPRLVEQTLQALRELVLGYDQMDHGDLLSRDERRVFGAFSQDVEPMPLLMRGSGMEPALARVGPQGFVVFYVTVRSVETFQHVDSGNWHHGQVIDHAEQQVARTVLEVNEVIHMHPDLWEPDFIDVNNILLADGGYLFNRGDRFVVMGSLRTGEMSYRGRNLDVLDFAFPITDRERITVGYVETLAELNALVNPWGSQWGQWDEIILAESYVEGVAYPQATYLRTEYVGGGWGSPISIERFRVELPYEQLPLEIKEWAVVLDETVGIIERGFVSLTTSFAEFYQSDRWEQIAEHIALMERSAFAIPILTTHDPVSLFEFHQHRNLFTEGRSFTEEEKAAGAQVALVSYGFARHNQLEIGDSIALELYNASLDTTLLIFSEQYDRVVQNVWTPTLYSPDLEVTESLDFTIVGIYRTPRIGQRLRADYIIPRNAIIIPDTAIGTLEGMPARGFAGLEAKDYIPLLDDALIVANGHVDEVIVLLNSYRYGFGYLFLYLDQGFDTLVNVLYNLLFGTTWLFVLAAFAWALVVFIFAMFYVSRKRKEAALLYALGISRGKRCAWIFAQCAFIILLAMATSLAVALPIYGDIVEVAAGAAQTFTAELRDMRLSDAAETGLRTTIPIRGEVGDVIQAAAIATGILLVVTAFVSASATVFKSLNKKVEE